MVLIAWCRSKTVCCKEFRSIAITTSTDSSPEFFNLLWNSVLSWYIWKPVVSYKRFFKIPKTKGGIKRSKLSLERNQVRCSARIYFGFPFVLQLHKQLTGQLVLELQTLYGWHAPFLCCSLCNYKFLWV